MLTHQLTKLELALDQLKKSHPKLNAADAALLTSALSLTGRHATAIYDGQQYKWPEDYPKLTGAMVGQLQLVQDGIDLATPKRAAKTTTDEEPIQVSVGLAPNYAAGEALLKGRDDLKTLLSDILQEGVEFTYQANDIGWQWALDRANWNTISGSEISRRIKIKTGFTEGAVGIEMGLSGPKKRKAAVKAPIVVAEPVEAEPVVSPDPEE